LELQDATLPWRWCEEEEEEEGGGGGWWWGKMSVWDFDEYGNPYPSEERPDYDDNLYDDSDDYNNAAHNHHRHLDEEEEHHHHHLIHHDNRDEAVLFSDDNGEPSHSHHSGSQAAHAAHHDHHHDGHHHSSPAAHHVHSHYEQQQPSQQLHHEDYQLHEHHVYEDHGNSSQNFDTVGNANDSTQHTSSPQQQQQQHSRNEDLFSSSRVMQLNLDEIDILATSHRSKPWLVVLYAPWCTYCQVHFLLPLPTIFSFPFSIDENTSHLGICVHMHAPGLLPFQKKKG
jgi:hypothetical protein